MNQIEVNSQRELLDQKTKIPVPSDNDLLVKVKAISVNPVDIKRIKRIEDSDPKVLGYDAVGEVVAKGSSVFNFPIGIQVFYAGTTKRNGSYADYQLVDYRNVAKAPNIAIEKSAALPLTWLTAYEILTDKLGLEMKKGENSDKSILVINGAGGAGSILTQLAHYMGVKVLATSSPENFDWLRRNRTDYPIDYHRDIIKQMQKYGFSEVDAVINLYDIKNYFDESIAAVKPFGHIVNVTSTNLPLDLKRIQNKSISLDFELMFTRSVLNYQVKKQAQALELLCELLEREEITSTVTQVINGGINTNNILKAHSLLKNNINGKIVVKNSF